MRPATISFITRIVFVISVLIAVAVIVTHLAKAADRGQIAVKPSKKPVTVYCMKACQQCRLQKYDCDRLTEYDFHYVEKPSEWPEWIQARLKAAETFPFVVWKGKDGKAYFMHGGEWIGPEVFIRRHDRSLK